MADDGVTRMFQPPKLRSSCMLRPVGVRLLKWSEITKVRELGIGSFSSVALHTTSTNEFLAVKTFRREVPVKKIIKEAGILSPLKHKNIARLIACSATDPMAIMLEYVFYDMTMHGIDMHISCLQTLIEEFDKSNFNQLEHVPMCIAKELVEGLQFLHHRDIAHRDLKPVNILVTNGDNWLRRPVIAKLTDFGESRSSFLQTQTVAQTMTTRTYRGTPSYMAPEILHQKYSSKLPVGHTLAQLKLMDIWSLSMVMHILLNPDLSTPYENDIEQRNALLPSTELFEQFVLKVLAEGLPKPSEKYNVLRCTNSSWTSLMNVYKFCVVKDPANRPDIEQIYRFIAEEEDNRDSKQANSSQNLSGVEASSIVNDGVSEQTDSALRLSHVEPNSIVNVGVFLNPVGSLSLSCVEASSVVHDGGSRHANVSLNLSRVEASSVVHDGGSRYANGSLNLSCVEASSVVHDGGSRHANVSLNLSCFEASSVVHDGGSRHANVSLNLSRVEASSVVHDGGSRYANGSLNLSRVEASSVVHDGGSGHANGSLNLSRVEASSVVHDGGSGHANGSLNLSRVETSSVVRDGGSRHANGSLNLSRVETSSVVRDGGSRHANGSLNLSCVEASSVVHDGGSRHANGSLNLSRVETSSVVRDGGSRHANGSLNLSCVEASSVVHDGGSRHANVSLNLSRVETSSVVRDGGSRHANGSLNLSCVEASSVVHDGGSRHANGSLNLSRVETSSVVRDGGSRHANGSLNLSCVEASSVVHDGGSRHANVSLNLSRVETSSVVRDGDSRHANGSLNLSCVEASSVVHDGGSRHANGSLNLSCVEASSVVHDGGSRHANGSLNLSRVETSSVVRDGGSRHANGSLNLSRVETSSVVRDGGSRHANGSLNLSCVEASSVVHDGGSRHANVSLNLSRVETSSVVRDGGSRHANGSLNLSCVEASSVVHDGGSRHANGSLNLSRVETSSVVRDGGSRHANGSLNLSRVETSSVVRDGGSRHANVSLNLSRVEASSVVHDGGSRYANGSLNLSRVEASSVVHDGGSGHANGSLNLSRVETSSVVRDGGSRHANVSLNLSRVEASSVVYDSCSKKSDAALKLPRVLKEDIFNSGVYRPSHGSSSLCHAQTEHVVYLSDLSVESDKFDVDTLSSIAIGCGTATSVGNTGCYSNSDTPTGLFMFRPSDRFTKRSRATHYHRYTSVTSGQNVQILPEVWRDCAIVHCDSIPFDMDGLQHYRIKCNEFNFMTVSKDGRPWEKWKTSKRRDFGGIRRISNCRGQPVCHAASCIIDGQPNRFHFKYIKENMVTVCKICGNVAEFRLCYCRKVLEYSGSVADSDAPNEGCLDVFHIGNHTCIARKPKASSLKIHELLSRNPGVTGSGAVSADLEKLFAADDVEWDKVEDVADYFVNQKQISNAKGAEKKLLQTHGISYDAVCKFKSNTDKHDKCMVYSLNNGEMNNGLPTYVFKSSKSSAHLALEMDRHGNSIHNTAFAHVDCKHDRVKKMKTVTCWMYHVQMQKLMCLGVMDISSETTENLTLFWNEFNKMLREVKGDDGYSFNPAGFVVDEHAANWSSIESVFGSDAIGRTYSCEFHYKQSLTRHSNKFVGCDKQTFKQLGNNLLNALTINAYREARTNMKNFSAANEGVVDSWLSWWDKRRKHVFKAFKPLDAPTVNYAESGHSSMANHGEENLTLIEACYKDATRFMKQKSEIKAFVRGGTGCGRGPSVQAKQNMSHDQQLRFAEAASNDLEDEAEELIMIDDDDANIFVATQGIHRPPDDDVHQKSKRMKSSGGTASKQKQKSSSHSKKVGAVILKPETLQKKTVATKKSTTGVTAKNRLTARILSNTGTARFTKEWHNDLPFVVSLYNKSTIKCRKCKSCSINFSKTPSVPHNIIINHHERYRYPQAGSWKFTESKTREEAYHCSAACVTKRHDYFDVSRLRLESRQEFKLQHRDLIKEEFGVSLSEIEDL